MDGALFFRFGGEVLSHLAIKKAGPEGDWVGSFSHLSTLPNSLPLWHCGTFAQRDPSKQQR